MTITAKVIAHSRASGAPDLITIEARYPRLIHSELLTHRVFSRNASSSRAIPIEKMIQSVIDDPAMPVAWGSNKPGMQAGDEIEETFWARETWLNARDAAVEHARAMANLGLHKQIVNRVIENFGHITTLITSTEWSNFFDLRCHPDADPTMRALAEAMRDAIEMSVPRVVESGEYAYRHHLPYFNDNDSGELATRGYDAGEKLFMESAMMISAARCARVSYLNHDGSAPDIDKDLALARRLLDSKHMSPFEHQARLSDPENMDTWLWGNLRGWDQHRKMIEVRPDEA